MRVTHVERGAVEVIEAESWVQFEVKGIAHLIALRGVAP